MTPTIEEATVVAENDRRDEQDATEPEQENPGGQARSDREDREYHDGV